MKDCISRLKLKLGLASLMLLGAVSVQSAELQDQSTGSVLSPQSELTTNVSESSDALFRPVPLGLSQNLNSQMMVAANEGVWRNGKLLPVGTKLQMALQKLDLPADGKSYTRIKVTMVDRRGQKLFAKNNETYKLHLETSLGRFQVAGVTTPQSGSVPVNELRALEVLVRNGEAELTLMAPATPGVAIVRAQSGAIGVQAKVNFSADLRPMIVVGLLEGTLSTTRVNKDANAPEIVNTSFEESLRNWTKTNSTGDRTSAARLSFFAKGAVKGEYLLTMAVDSDKLIKEQLFRDIDPNAFYPIYGDASIKQHDAQSKSRLFARVDKNRSYALYGDYTTEAQGASTLGAYHRSLTGAKLHAEEKNYTVDVFGAKDTLRSYVDEQQGCGMSGPYAVGKPNAVANSEQVTIIVRDRIQPAVVLKTTRMARFVDYDFEPFSGRILFRQPIPSVDENLNPIYIRTVYEVEEGGDKFWVAGVSGKIKLTEDIAVGASYAQDQNPVAGYKLSGVNAQFKLGSNTGANIEYARSTGTQYYNQAIAPVQLGVSTPVGSGKEGAAFKASVRHEAENYTGSAHYAQSGADFQNSGGGLMAGRIEAALRGNYRFSDSFGVNSEITRSQDNTGEASATHGSKRDSAYVGVGIKLSEAIKLDVGISHSAQHVVGGSGGIANVGVGASSNSSFGFNGTGLLSNPSNATGLTPSAASQVLSDAAYNSVRARLGVKLTDRANVYGEYERATGDRRTAGVGGEYRITDQSRMYARHQQSDGLAAGYGLGSGVKASNTVLGVDTSYMKDGQLFSEYRLAGSQNGAEAATALGVRNLWRLSDGLAATTSLERQHVRDYQGNAQDATAGALGLEYTAHPLYRLGGKLELRSSSVQEQGLLLASVTRKLSANWSLIGRNLYMQTKGVNGSTASGVQTQDRIQLGAAYRDTQTNQFHGLMRVEHRIDKNTAVASPQDTRTTIASLHGNYHPIRSWTVAGQVAGKNVNELFGSSGISSQWQGHLLAGRMIWDFAERFDVSVYGSAQKGGSSNYTGVGAELGVRVVDSLWLSAGYTTGKYSDTDMFSANTSRGGWHVRLRFAFDEKTFSSNDPKVNRTLDAAGEGVHKSPRQWRE
jgi:hypothetical protein